MAWMMPGCGACSPLKEQVGGTSEIQWPPPHSTETQGHSRSRAEQRESSFLGEADSGENRQLCRRCLDLDSGGQRANPTLVSYWLCRLEKDFVSLSLSFSSCKRGTMMLTLLGNCEVLRRFLGLI